MDKYQYACDVFRRTQQKMLKGLTEEKKMYKVGDLFESLIHEDQLKELRDKK